MQKTLEEIKAMFPLTGQITQEIIDSANIYDENKCIGARTLKAAVPDLDPELYNISWLLWNGHIRVESGELVASEEHSVTITTDERINMMSITKPQEVTFIVL